MSFLRFTNKTLPPYAFIPGKHPHPLKNEKGHMAQEGEPELEPLDPEHWDKNEDYLYSLDLLNTGYFWESHVWLEALWNAHKRTGPEAELFKALIKIGAAGIKARMGSESPAEGHLERAKELIHKAFELAGNGQLLGFTKENLLGQIDQILEQLPDYVQDAHRERRTFPPLAPCYRQITNASKQCKF